MVVTDLFPFSLQTLILRLSKDHRISDEENHLHVSQLLVCPFEGVRIRRWSQLNLHRGRHLV